MTPCIFGRSERGWFMGMLCLLVWINSAFAQKHDPKGTGTKLPLTNAVSVDLTPEEKRWIAVHPQIRWGADPSWPPFSSFDNKGRLIGIDAEITRLVAERVGIHLSVVHGAAWSEILSKAQKGEADFLSGTGKLPERTEKFEFTRQYGSFPVVIIMRDEAPFLTLEPKLGTLKLAAARDYALTQRLQQDYPRALYIYTDDTEQAVKMVSSGKADATVVNLAVATRAIRLNGLTNLKIAGITRYEYLIHFAVRKDWPELARILDKGLASITPAEEERIYAKYLTPDVDEARDWGTWRRRALYSAVAGIVITSLALVWNFFLKRQIQRRKAAEAALREARDRLEQHARQLDARVKEVEKLNAELTTANQNLETFSSSVSHDLRAPLRRIITFTGLLQETTGDSPQPEARDMMKAIVHESTSMDRLIRDLLEFARLGRAELHKQTVNMVKLVQKVIADFQPQYRDRVVIWKVGDLVEAYGDPNLLHYALANLIDNALKYTRARQEARITIDMVPGRSNKQEAVYFVRDNGCGFDMKDAKKIFAPFQRLHSSAEFEGTGMGLANVQRIIHKHGGWISFESEPNKGTTFSFALPRPPSTPM